MLTDQQIIDGLEELDWIFNGSYLRCYEKDKKNCYLVINSKGDLKFWIKINSNDHYDVFFVANPVLEEWAKKKLEKEIDKFERMKLEEIINRLKESDVDYSIGPYR